LAYGFWFFCEVRIPQESRMPNEAQEDPETMWCGRVFGDKQV